VTAAPAPARRDGIGPFVTVVERVNPDGLVSRWESRRHRKHLDPSAVSGSTWWAPTSRGWWIAVLFAVGSLLFAVGAVPSYAGAVGARWDSVTFFVGSLFFTSAAFLTYREAVDAGPVGTGPGDAGPAGTLRSRRRKVFVYQPGRIDWWATAVQLVGTFFFNVSTGYATVQDLTAEVAHRHVWRPDALGSVCFLVASALAWFEVCHGWVALRARVWGWWIALLNLAGSIAFGVSAVAGYINPATGHLLNAERSNRGTFVGAVCFLIGALFLLPERTEALGTAIEAGSG
jgi:hypothetical protein